VQAFESRAALDAGLGKPARNLAPVSVLPSLALWSSKRIQAFRESLTQEYRPAIAILRIPKIQLEVPVLEGTDELTLNRGVGLISETAYPGSDKGNIGIAGHRDGFFRGLKDIGPGDRIQMVLQEGQTENYIVDRILIVAPSDISVLSSRSTPSLTLVTCYPFYYVGTAPRRYIVQASKTDFESTSLSTSQAAITTVSKARP
jgi:sortase A